MTTPARTYPPVRSVTRMIPSEAQARLRAMHDGPDKRAAVEWLILGMAYDPAKVVVDLDKMQVTSPIEPNNMWAVRHG